jgi:hypothetical protein
MSRQSHCFDFITRTMLGEEYRSRSSSLCSFRSGTEYRIYRLRQADFPNDTFRNIHRPSSFAVACSCSLHVFRSTDTPFSNERFRMNQSSVYR